MEARWIISRMMGMGSVRDLPTFGGDLLLNGWADDESEHDYSRRVLYREQAAATRSSTRTASRRPSWTYWRMTHEDGPELAYIAQNAKDRIPPLLRGRREDSRPPPPTALRRSSNAACTAATCCTR